jgi:hypothetical protein
MMESLVCSSVAELSRRGQDAKITLTLPPHDGILSLDD